MTLLPEKSAIPPRSFYSSEEWTGIGAGPIVAAQGSAALQAVDALGRLLSAHHAGGSKAISVIEVLRSAAAVVNAETLAWLPANEARPATIVTATNLDEIVCRQLLHELPLEIGAGSESLYLRNMPLDHAVFAAAQVRNLLVLKSAGGQMAAWLLAVNRVGGFSAQDVRLLAPFINLIHVSEASTNRELLESHPVFRRHGRHAIGAP